MKSAPLNTSATIIIAQARKSLGFSRGLGFLQGDPSDILVVEMTGENASEVRSKLEAFSASIQRGAATYAVTLLLEPGEQRQVWAMREAGLGLMMNVEGDAKPLPFVEDTAVAPNC